MAPKEKKKKKTKAEIEEEQRKLEEEARLAEEERLRLEALEAAKRAAEERARQKRAEAHLAAEAERLQSERELLEPWMQQQEAQLAQVRKQRREQAEWRRFLSCSPLPNPHDARQMQAHLSGWSPVIAAASGHAELERGCQADLNLLEDCQRLQLAAWLSTDPAEAAQHAYFGKLAEDLRLACLARLDLITGHVLQESSWKLQVGDEASSQVLMAGPSISSVLCYPPIQPNLSRLPSPLLTPIASADAPAASQSPAADIMPPAADADVSAQMASAAVAAAELSQPAADAPGRVAADSSTPTAAPGTSGVTIGAAPSEMGRAQSAVTVAAEASLQSLVQDTVAEVAGSATAVLQDTPTPADNRPASATQPPEPTATGAAVDGGMHATDANASTTQPDDSREAASGGDPSSSNAQGDRSASLDVQGQGSATMTGGAITVPTTSRGSSTSRSVAPKGLGEPATASSASSRSSQKSGRDGQQSSARSFGSGMTGGYAWHVPEIGAQIHLNEKALGHLTANQATLRLSHVRHGQLTSCNRHLAACGGVWLLEALPRPPVAATQGQWLVAARPSIPSTKSDLARLDLKTSRSQGGSLGLSLELPEGNVNVDMRPHGACWNSEGSHWDDTVPKAQSLQDRTLSFHTSCLSGCFAQVQSLASLLPYQGWTLRPIGGRGARRFALDINTSVPGKLLGFEFQRDAVMLASCPFPELEDCMGTALSPEKLLQQLTSRGLPLLVPPAAVAAAGLTCKEGAAERRACRDVAFVAPACLVASSRWNQSVGPDGCLFRMSEVVDWEGEGRTSASHAARIFSKEKASGAQSVQAILCRKGMGVALSPARDSLAEVPDVPQPGSADFTTSPFAQMHAHLLPLLTPEAPEAAVFTMSEEGMALMQDAPAEDSDAIASFLWALQVFSSG